jgi:hypothetical protein
MGKNGNHWKYSGFGTWHGWILVEPKWECSGYMWCMLRIWIYEKQFHFSLSLHLKVQAFAALADSQIMN